MASVRHLRMASIVTLGTRLSKIRGRLGHRHRDTVTVKLTAMAAQCLTGGERTVRTRWTEGRVVAPGGTGRD